MPCSRRDSVSWLARRLRTGGAYLVGGAGGGVEQLSTVVVTRQQTTLKADSKVTGGELMDGNRAAHEMDAVAARR